ncbi:MAG TPA: PAS domain S-box protein [Bryobacteraceae bacterium]|nr:PAS domain S-box protein [Bryobacteraceae bacterium]
MLLLAAAAGWSQTRQGDNVPTLTRVSEIRALTPAEADRPYPIRIRAVVTYNNPAYGTLFVQDKTAGTYLFHDGANPTLPAGTLVEVTGTTTPGSFAPAAKADTIRIVGRAPLPSVPASDLAALTGSADCQWVKVRGVVHSAGTDRPWTPDGRAGPPVLVLQVASGSDRLKVQIQTFSPSADYSGLVDALVTVQGVVGSIFNDRRQLTGVELLTPSLAQITVDQAPEMEAFAIPAVPIANLMRFSPKRILGRRTHIRGVVTLNSPSSAFVQDASGGVLVETDNPAAVKPGDLIDVAGFPTFGGYTPILTNGVFLRAGKSRQPAPSDLSDPASLSSGGHDAELVRVAGQLLNQSLIGNRLVLTLELGGHTFTAVLEPAGNSRQIRSINKGSKLRVTGIWRAEIDEYHDVVGHQVLLRSVADVTVIHAAPWLTVPRVLILVGALAGLLMLALRWVSVLTRHVREKTETVRAILESTEDGILAVDPAGWVVACNRKFLEMWRITEVFQRPISDETLGLVFAEQIKNPDLFLEEIRALRQDSEHVSNGALEFKDGRVYERHSEPQRVNGKCTGRVWGFRDVTERNKAEERLRALSAAVEQSPVSIVVTDLDGNIEYVNPHFTEATGYAFEEVRGRNPRILKSGETSEDEYRNMWRTIGSGKPWRGTFHNKKKSGELYWETATVCAIRDESGSPSRYLAVKEDITEHRRAVEALQESERRYRGLFENMLEGFAYCEMEFENGEAADFIYLAVNDKFDKLTGLKDVVGKRVSEVIPGIRKTDQGLLDIYGRVARTGQPEKFETYVEAMQMWFSISVYSPERGYFVAVFDVITERKRAEEALHLTQSAMDQAPLSVLWLDPDGKIVYANNAACCGLGYSAAELLSKTIRDIAADDLEAEAWSQSSDPQVFEGLHRHKSGRVFPVEVTSQHIEFAGKWYSCNFCNDITERKKAQAALRTSEERFRIAAENASDLIFEFDLDSGQIQYFGEGLQARYPKMLFPATVNEWPRIVHPADLGRIAAAIQTHQTTRKPLREQYRLVQSDGSVLHVDVHSTITFDPLTGRYKDIGVARDITQQRAAEEANAEIAAIVKATNVAVIRKDSLGRVLTWNSGAEHLYGYSAGEMIGQTAAAIVPPDRAQEERAIAESLAKGNEVNSLETVRVNKAGARIDVILTATPIRDNAGNSVGSAFIVWDITDRKYMQQQLAQAQKLESIGRLAAGIAHEINTPIQYIGDNARFLGEAFQDLFKVIGCRRTSDAPVPGAGNGHSSFAGLPPDVDLDYLQREVPAAIGQLEEGVANVARIVGAMKAFSHPARSEKASVDINRALESTILVSRNEWKYVAEVTQDFDPGLPLVPCLAGEMNQVFLNLIVNAAHAIGDAVKDTGRKGAITVGTRRNGDWAEIRVQDTGAGIPDEIRTKIFDPFFTTKDVGKGTGQGLAIAHDVVVQKHRGEIDFVSAVGEGTTFFVRLPLSSMN